MPGEQSLQGLSPYGTSQFRIAYACGISNILDFQQYIDELNLERARRKGDGSEPIVPTYLHLVVATEGQGEEAAGDEEGDGGKKE